MTRIGATPPAVPITNRSPRESGSGCVGIALPGSREKHNRSISTERHILQRGPVLGTPHAEAHNLPRARVNGLFSAPMPRIQQHDEKEMAPRSDDLMTATTVPAGIAPTARHSGDWVRIAPITAATPRGYRAERIEEDRLGASTAPGGDEARAAAALSSRSASTGRSDSAERPRITRGRRRARHLQQERPLDSERNAHPPRNRCTAETVTMLMYSRERTSRRLRDPAICRLGNERRAVGPAMPRHIDQKPSG